MFRIIITFLQHLAFLRHLLRLFRSLAVIQNRLIKQLKNGANENRQTYTLNNFVAGSSIENRNPCTQKLLIDILEPRFDPN